MSKSTKQAIDIQSPDFSLFKNTEHYNQQPITGNVIVPDNLNGYKRLVIDDVKTPYYINRKGYIYSPLRKRLLTVTLLSSSLIVYLRLNNDKVRGFQISRLVLLTFNKEFREQYKDKDYLDIDVTIIHKDGNPYNTDLSNLEWLDGKHKNKIRKTVPILVKDILNNKVLKFKSFKEINKELGITYDKYVYRVRTGEINKFKFQDRYVFLDSSYIRKVRKI